MKLKNKIILLLLTFMFSMMFLSNKSLAVNTIDVKVSGIMDYTKAGDVLNIVNQERKAIGLNELKMDAELQEAAMTRAAEIGLIFDKKHTRPNGTEWYTICSKSNGENIALGMTNANQVMSEWMNSTEGHREAILYKDFNSIGVGCFKNGDVYYWVQIFSISNATMETTKTGTQIMTYYVSVLNDNLQLYVRKSNNTYASYMDIGTSGQYIYGINNKGEQAYNYYSVGVESDYNFNSSNSNVIKINSDGTFKTVGEGTATITISLKSSPDIKKSEIITVKLLKPTKITGLETQNHKKTSFEIKWNLQNETADKYEVYMYNSKKKDFELLGRPYSNGGEFYGLQAGTTYKVRVRAVRTVNGKTYYGPYSELKTTTATEKTKISKLKGAKKKLSLSWKKISKATGYQVQVATDKKFTKNKKSITISKNKTISKTIKKLKSKKKYYVRVRTYRKVGGKKVYSGWCSVKNIKTK